MQRLCLRNEVSGTAVEMASARRVALAWCAAVSLALAACGGRAHSRHGEKPPGESPCGLDLECDPDSALEPAEEVGEPDRTAPVAPLNAPCGPDGTLEHSVDVGTQSDLYALASCRRITGDLTINAFDGFDGTPLAALQRVDGVVTVYATRVPDAPVLDSLRGLEEVGGLHLHDLALPSLAPLAGLRRIVRYPSDATSVGSRAAAGDLVIANCTQLESLKGLDSLETVSAVNLIGNPQLRSLEGLTRAPQLERLWSDSCPLENLQGLEPLSVRDLAVSFSALKDLTGLGSAPELDRLWLSANSELTLLDGVQLPASMGEITLLNNPLSSLRTLAGLKSVSKLLIVGNLDHPGLDSLLGLDALADAGSLEISEQPQLSDLSGLGSLAHVQGLRLHDDPALASLAGLSSLRTLDGLELSQLGALTNLHGLGSASIGSLNVSDVALHDLLGLEGSHVLSQLSIADTPQLVSLAGFPAIDAGASLSITDAPALTELEALSSLTAIGTLLLHNTGAENLDALAQLRQVGTLNLSSDPRLSQLDGLSGLTQMSFLIVESNPVLSRLPTFSQLEADDCADCGGISVSVVDNPLLETGPGFPLVARAYYITIKENAALVSLSGLQSLRAIDGLAVVDNPKLSDFVLSHLEQAQTILIRGNGGLDDTLLAPLRALPGADSIKIVSNSSGPSHLNPCPWRSDSVCDEEAGDCADGSDAEDCVGWTPAGP